jgi:hypothetical protein
MPMRGVHTGGIGGPEEDTSEPHGWEHDMSEPFKIGDRVVGANRHGRVEAVGLDNFRRGGVQQVVTMRCANGESVTMRAAHFTHEPTVQDHTDGSGA